MKRLRSPQPGQAIVEYALLLGLLVVVVIALAVLMPDLNNLFNDTVSDFGGGANNWQPSPAPTLRPH